MKEKTQNVQPYLPLFSPNEVTQAVVFARLTHAQKARVISRALEDQTDCLTALKKVKVDDSEPDHAYA